MNDGQPASGRHASNEGEENLAFNEVYRLVAKHMDSIEETESNWED